MDATNGLLDCSAIMLQALIDLYKNRQISYREFIENSKLKVVFLEYLLNSIDDSECKSSIERLLNNYYAAV